MKMAIVKNTKKLQKVLELLTKDDKNLKPIVIVRVRCNKVRAYTFSVERAFEFVKNWEPGFLVIAEEHGDVVDYKRVTCKRGKSFGLFVHSFEMPEVHRWLSEMAQEKTFKEMLKEFPEVAKDVVTPFAVIMPDGKIRIFGQNKHCVRGAFEYAENCFYEKENPL